MTNTKTKTFEKAEIKKLAKSQLEITASIPSSIWESYRAQALKNINNTVTIDGFRKGMVPENILVSKVGEKTINEEMAEMAISRAYLDVIVENKIDAIGKPQVQLTKLAPGNPLEFKIITSTIPEVKLPDYKKIAKNEVEKNSKKDIEVSEKEIEEAITKIRKAHTKHSCPDGEACEHDHEGQESQNKDEPLPEITDEFVRTIGEFKDVADFKEKVKNLLKQNKTDEAKEKLRIKIADAIAGATEVEIPDIMIQSELDRTQAQFSSDVERMGIKMEDYLKHAKKTIEDIRKDWLPHAEKKAKLQLILNSIATAENIRPNKKEIEEEVEHIVKHYKDADKERASVYAETVLTNEKVFQMLEA